MSVISLISVIPFVNRREGDYLVPPPTPGSSTLLTERQGAGFSPQR